MKGISKVIIFAAGAICGYFVAKKQFDKKLNEEYDRMDSEIEAMREYYEDEHDDTSDEEEESSEDEEEENHLQKREDRTWYEKLTMQYFKRDESGRFPEPYLISESVYENHPAPMQFEVTYYKDGVLSQPHYFDPWSEDKIETCIGLDNLNTFVDYQGGDILCVRNEGMQSDYRITRVYLYSDEAREEGVDYGEDDEEDYYEEGFFDDDPRYYDDEPYDDEGAEFED